MRLTAAFLLLVVSSVGGFGQLPSSRCDSTGNTLADCPAFTPLDPAQNVLSTVNASSAAVLYSDPRLAPGSQAAVLSATNDNFRAGTTFLAPQPPLKQGFHWGRFWLETFIQFSVEQAYVVKDDYRWIVIEKGVPFNHYWRDYKQSLSTWVHSGWNDGDPHMYGYIGHPVQGAFTSYVQIQNDPQGEKLEFSKTKAYWRSRLKATLWNAVYSTLWNIGPLSEPTIEKYGTKVRPPWSQDGSWPCKRHCLTGVGQIDLVMTPVGGLGWLVGEDFLDKKVVRRVEDATRNRFLIDAVRCALNPVRTGANILHGNRPWARLSRDRDVLNSSTQDKTPVPAFSASVAERQR